MPRGAVCGADRDTAAVAAAAVAEENSSVPGLLAVPTLIMPASPGSHCFYNSPELYAVGKGGGQPC